MKFSIITINRNYAKGLERSIKSVIGQTYKDIEYIVIDGGSTDDSKAVIERHEDSIAYWVSESDRGIYHAMNKGIKVATGEYVLFLNSGDVLASADVLAAVHDTLRRNDTDYFTGAVDIVSLRGQKISQFVPPAQVSLFYFIFSALQHQGTFIRRKLLADSLYDESLKICADWKQMLIALGLNNATYSADPTLVVAKFELGGITSSVSELPERKAVLREILSADDYRIYQRLEDPEQVIKISRLEHRYIFSLIAAVKAVVRFFRLIRLKYSKQTS